ncbi:hypothetical protein RHAL1_02864 [Beijerinckiaceae bacterium RH AL1]|jgi:two-component system, response regulator PdtaR|nr:response regulator [Beijerinckiaceae bacterium]VVB47539.1 hypothetical protein RHCH11_RHCH11_02803 [Beijerinckiaceae bacterium RH CH11]VVB47620.1 hypothetical protein RHAL8_02799 [Beijerinckiaceae bacterium RH AL8]VVC55940.1 hypothetical protein RHAL1_02864 [Beijerinckiaceae bacterium RH AL1]
MRALRAIVADDDPLVLPVITTVLSDAGFEVLRATDSDIAIDLLERSEEIDLLFTDVVMPGKVDGLGLARVADARWPSIAIVVSSGRIVPKPQMLPMGAVFLPKPFYADHILWFACRALGAKGKRLPETGDQ